MARNKYPEETERLILQTALKLFLEKGYDNTSIQDIIDRLGGLSKGAIYHHFKSKEAILIQLMNEMDGYIEETLSVICRDKTKNGFEKLQELFRQSLLNSDKETAFLAAPNLMKNPRMLAMHIESIFKEIVPGYIQPVIEEGVADGSIQTEYPKELAEVLILLSNVWLNPIVFADLADEQVLMRRVEFYRQMLEKMGLSLIDDEMMGNLNRLGDMYYDRKKQRRNS